MRCKADPDTYGAGLPPLPRDGELLPKWRDRAEPPAVRLALYSSIGTERPTERIKRSALPERTGPSRSV